MSYINWGSESPDQLALRRRIEEHALYEQAVRVARARAGQAPGAVGEGSSLPRAIKISARTATVSYVDPVTNIIKIFVVDYDNPEDLAFSQDLDTKIDATTLDSSYFESMIDGKGWLFRANGGPGVPSTILFIDAGANLIDTAVCALNTNFNTFSEDGILAGVSYTDVQDGTVKMKWWAGDAVYTRTFNNVDGDAVSIDRFSSDDCTLDGTSSCYYYDTVLNKERVFLMNGYTGAVREVTDLLTYKGEGYYNNGMCQLGNFIFVNFQIPYNNTLVADYVDGDDFLVLSAFNTNIQIGDLVTGDDIPGSTYVINIDGPTVYLSNPVLSTNLGVNVDFNAQRMELLRIIKTNGSHIDFDTSSYHAWSTWDWGFIGTGKLVIHYEATGGQDTAVPDTILMYNGASDAIYTTTIDKLVYSDTSWFYQNRKYLFNDSNSSPEGTEVFCAAVYDPAASDGKMERWNSGKFIWTNPVTGEIYTHTVSVGLGTFGFGNYGSPSNPAMFFVDNPDSEYLQILVLNSDGTADYVDTPTLYTDADNYYQIVPLGDNYTLFTYNDNSRTGDIQFYGVWKNASGYWIDNSWFWATINNMWDTNYDTFYMAELTEDKTYWWNAVLGDADTIPQQIAGATAYQSSQEANDYGASYVDFHTTGTTLLKISATEGYIIASDSVAPALLDLNGDLDNYQFFNQYTIYNLWQNALDSDKWIVDAYDTAGNLLLTINTSYSSISTWRVANNRVFLLQETDITDVSMITAISAESVNVKTFPSANFNSVFNDWAFD